MDTLDPYEILGVSRDATSEEIKAAYRRIAKAAHPDAAGSDTLFRLVQGARDTLLDETRRAEYNSNSRRDTTQSAPPPPSRTTHSSSTRPPSSNHSSHSSATPRRPQPTVRSRATVFGGPGTANDGPTGRAGFDGEATAGQQIMTVPLPDTAFVFHGVVPSGGSGDVDLVVVAGNRLLLIDAKRWAPGTYETRADGCYRDGRRYTPGDLTSTDFLSNLLINDIGWSGSWHRLVAVSSSTDNPDDVNLNGFTSNLQVVKTADLGSYVQSWLDQDGTDLLADPALLARLHARTRDQFVVIADSPIDAPRLPAGAVNLPRTGRSQWAMFAAVAACIVAIGTLTLLSQLGTTEIPPAVRWLPLLGPFTAVAAMLITSDGHTSRALTHAETVVGISAPTARQGDDILVGGTLLTAGVATLATLIPVGVGLGVSVGRVALALLCILVVVTYSRSAGPSPAVRWARVFDEAATRLDAEALLVHALRVNHASDDVATLKTAANSVPGLDDYLFGRAKL